MSLNRAKVALVFDWMTNLGGAERVNLALHKMFPKAPIFTSIFNKDKIKGFESAAIQTSFIQNLPFAKKHHQFYLGLMPYAYEQFDLSSFDIVISSSHSCAKGVITKPETLHISYCHTPMRYAWDNWHSYVRDYKMNSFIKGYAKKRLHKIRIWDSLSANRVDHFVANSSTTKKRIEKYYKRSSSVIHPPIKLNEFKISKETKGYYLAVGRLTPYKKFDLIVETFNQIGLPLKIVGTGIQFDQLRRTAKANIEFLGNLPDNEVRHLYSECEALIFPQIEDFGITPLESMASGRPVIALGQGGATDTIKDGLTGVFFDKQTPLHLKGAIEKYQSMKDSFDSEIIRNHASQFDISEFEKKLMKYLRDKWETWQKTMQ